jgi:hypothetical protein
MKALSVFKNQARGILAGENSPNEDDDYPPEKRSLPDIGNQCSLESARDSPTRAGRPSKPFAPVFACSCIALDFDNPALCGDDNCLRAVSHTQSPQNNVDVPLNGSSGDIESL